MGIRAYLREISPWSIILTEQGVTHTDRSLLKAWKPDGIIARIETPELRDMFRNVGGLPIVEISGHHGDSPFPQVKSCDREAGRLGAEHLLELGYRDLAFLTDSQYVWANERQAGFVHEAEKANARIHLLDRTTWVKSKAGVAGQRNTINKWVEGLPDVVGAMACNDILAQQVIESANDCGRPVPDRMAVLGVDDDDLLCDLTDPPLSSVALDTYRIGYTAAQMLETLMRGETLDRQVYEVDPVGVTRRRSTDAVFVDDTELVEAMRYIRDHACDGIRVHDVLKHVSLTRRVLDSRMAKHIGHTAYEEILRIKINRATLLLSDTTLPISTISRYCGFKEAECLNVAFKRSMGVTPGQYRTKRNTGLVTSKPELKRQNSRRKHSA
jgi:LacI family transcriptional regulator